MEVKGLTARAVEGRQVRPGRVQSVLVGLPAFDDPNFERIVGDAVEVGEGRAVEQLQVARHKLGADPVR